MRNGLRRSKKAGHESLNTDQIPIDHEMVAIHTSATKATTVTVLNCPPLVIQNSFHTLCIRRNAGSPSLPRRGVIAGYRALNDPRPTCQNVAALPSTATTRARM